LLTLIYVDDPAATKVSFPLLNGPTSSERTYDDIRRWLNFCDESHAKCAQEAIDSTLDLPPSRLINVSPAELTPETVRLENTQDFESNVKYAALSYCW
jgi:hypothetical protein